jgi:hypothetical protein
MVAAGRLPHEFFAVAAWTAGVPTMSTLNRPHDSTAVPASARAAADPACRFLTVLASPRSMS